MTLSKQLSTTSNRRWQCLIQKIKFWRMWRIAKEKILMWKNNTSESNKRRNNAIFKQDVAKLPRCFAVDNWSGFKNGRQWFRRLNNNFKLIFVLKWTATSFSVRNLQDLNNTTVTFLTFLSGIKLWGFKVNFSKFLHWQPIKSFYYPKIRRQI
jgi:hypothetical protein